MLALPPNVAPTNGVNSQSADAVAGAAAEVRAINEAVTKNLRSMSLLRVASAVKSKLQ